MRRCILPQRRLVRCEAHSFPAVVPVSRLCSAVTIRSSTRLSHHPPRSARSSIVLHPRPATSSPMSTSVPSPAPTRAEAIAAATGPVGPLTFSLTTPDELSKQPQLSTDCAVLFLTEEAASSQSLDLSLFHPFLPPSSVSLTPSSWQDFTGRAKQSLLFYPSSTSSIPRLLLIGLGKAASVTPLTLRTAAHSTLTHLRHHRIKRATVALPHTSTIPIDTAVDLFTRTAVLSNHTFARYLTPKDNDKLHCVQHCTLVVPSTSSPSPSTLLRAQVTAESQVMARELINDRGDVITPSMVEAFARLLATSHSLKLHVVKDDELLAEGLNLISAVGRGSIKGENARIVVLEYAGDPDSDRRLALVGKTISYDTGGLNIKATGHMEEMYMDKAGGCAVLGVMRSLAVLRPKVNVVGVLAVAENSIGSAAYKPHSILHTSKGTVEVGNTDAEGRLALADAFTLVQRSYSPSTIVDVATLTGACVVALGEQLGGLFSNDEGLSKRLQRASKRTAEELWPLPIHASHREALKTTYADIRSTGKGKGGASVAAAFLRHFIDEGVKWAHLDIAGPAMLSEAKEWRCKGGTGFGVQLLTDFVLAEADTAAAKSQRTNPADHEGGEGGIEHALAS